MKVVDLHLNLKCHSSTGIFKHFASKNQLPGLSVSGTLVEKGLNKFKQINKLLFLVKSCN